jgi:hypothetical protein
MTLSTLFEKIKNKARDALSIVKNTTSFTSMSLVTSSWPQSTRKEKKSFSIHFFLPENTWKHSINLNKPIYNLNPTFN